MLECCSVLSEDRDEENTDFEYGLSKKQELAENAEAAAKQLAIEHQLEKITDINEMMKSGVMVTPALAIDGCDLNCLEQAGFTQFKHMRVTDLGMEKGHTHVIEENIVKVLAKGREALAWQLLTSWMRRFQERKVFRT